MTKWHNEWARKEIREFGFLISETPFNSGETKIFGIKHRHWQDYHWSIGEDYVYPSIWRCVKYYIWCLGQKLQGKVFE